MKKLSFILLLLGLCSAPACGWAATNWTKIAVMPFQNSSAIKALEPWRGQFAEGLEHWLGTAEPFKFEVAGSKEVRTALTKRGWKIRQEVTPDLAGKVAQDLGCSIVVLGGFSRAEGLWKMKIRILRPGSDEAGQTLEIADRSTHQLLLHLAEKTCATLEATPCPAAVALTRAYPMSDRTLDALARLKEPKTKAANASYMKAARKILASEPTCFSARAGLARGLVWAEKLEEAAAESRKLVQQAPGLCVGHVWLAMSLQGSEQEKKREEELLAALKVHPGCPPALRVLFQEWGRQERWADLRKVCEQAHQALPAEKATSAFLAATMANLGDRKGARALLSELDVTKEEDAAVHIATLVASATRSNAEPGLAAREVLWLQRHRASDSMARNALPEIDASLQWVLPEHPHAPAPPRAYTPQELRAELKKRLTPEERALAASPIAVTKNIQATARQLTQGLTNAQLKLTVLFGYVAEQHRNAKAASDQSNTTNAPQQACHYYASQLVALARAVGIPAWLVHVDIVSEQISDSHDRAAVMVAGRLAPSDPTWEYLYLPWDPEEGQFRILDDLQAIAHHLCQSSSLASMKAGLKLDPDDLRTRIICVTRMADLGEVKEAEELFNRLPPESTNRWDYYLARGVIEARKEDYVAARRSLEQADKLGPNNANVKLYLGAVYGSLKDHRKSTEYMQKAMELKAALRPAGNRQDTGTRDTELTSRTAPGAVSLDTLRSWAKAGDAGALMVLVNRLFKLGEKERDEALSLLRQAAEEGNPVVQENYARNLLGLRGPIAAEEAFDFFRRAARQGEADAQYQLGKLLYEGKVIQKDEVEACEWMHLAAGQGGKEARSLLEEMRLFLDRAVFEEGMKRAQNFKPVAPATEKKVGTKNAT